MLRLGSTHGDLAPLLRRVVQQGGHMRVAAVGLSMAPYLLPGDRMVLGALRANEPFLGQVVVWERDGRLVAHRVIERRSEVVLTRGDSCPGPDRAVPRAALIAVMRKRERSGRACIGALARLAARCLSSLVSA